MEAAHGLALKRAHFSHLLEHGPGEVDWFELVSENFFGRGGRAWAVVERLRRERPLALHGTALGLGNPEGVDGRYLQKLEQVVHRVEPVRVSDHLCWVGISGEYSHELLPLPHTEEAVALVATQILKVQDRLKRRILVENPSTYVAQREAELSEGELLSEVARRADCELLIDLNNVLVNAHNHGFEPRALVDALPAERVGEYHLSGASPFGHLLVDTHVGPVPEAVWDLYRYALERIGPRPTLVEWDTSTPSFELTAHECSRARAIERGHLERREVGCALRRLPSVGLEEGVR